ncbi:MAG: PhnD/SsuA/transferrin family substrate-binding protein [Pseudomonadota bacterium]
MSELVSLPMYDWPELRDPIDALYGRLRHALRSAGFDAPATLNRVDENLTVWRSNALLLSQTCGLPYVTALRDHVTLIGTPRFAVRGCDNGHYASAIVVRHDTGGDGANDVRGLRAVVNGPDSQSGFAALNHVVLRAGGGTDFFASCAVSGSHRASAAAVARGEADVCAIDPVSWQLIQDWDSEVAARLRVITWSDRVPALPLVTAHTRSDDDCALLAAAVRRVFEDPESRDSLYLNGLEPLVDADYDIIATDWDTQRQRGLIA